MTPIGKIRKGYELNPKGRNECENIIAPVGKRIRALRKYRNMTGEGLAREIPVNGQGVRYYEAGGRIPTKAALRRIADICHVTMGYFEDEDILTSDLTDNERLTEIIKKYSFGGVEMIVREIDSLISEGELSESEMDKFIHGVNEVFSKTNTRLELTRKV